MFGSIALDVLIGLVFIFFVASVACSAAVEALFAQLRWRQKNLEQALHQLLGGNTDKSNTEESNTDKSNTAKSTVEEFLSHPLVLPSTSASHSKGRLSYLPARVFADVMIDFIGRSPAGVVSYERFRRSVFSDEQTNEGPPASQVLPEGERPRLPTSKKLRQALATLAEIAERQVPDGDGADAQRLVLLRGELERWYDQTMERASGWYKRRVQKALLLSALVVVLLLNLDTIAVTRQLFQGPAARETLKALALEKVDATESERAAPPGVGGAGVRPGLLVADDASSDAKAEGKTWRQSVQELHALGSAGLPLGWSEAHKEWKEAKGGWDRLWYVLLKLVGLGTSVMAISLGAPFWFDVLNKVSNLRSAGKRPPDSVATQAAGSPSAALAAADIAAAAGAGPGATPGGLGGGAVALGPAGSDSALAIGGRARSVAPQQAGLPADYWSQEIRTRDRVDFDPRFELPESAPGDATAAAATRKGFACNAAFLAKAALLAYRPPESIRPMIPKWGFDPARYRFFDCKDTQAFVAADDTMVLVSFRGTEPTRLQDILSDARIALATTFAGGQMQWAEQLVGKVHSGFLGALECVLAETSAEIKRVSNDGQIPIWITGHSLGGALATLLATALSIGIKPHNSEPIRLPVQGLYTFGSPRVGNIDFVKDFPRYMSQRKCVRFVNGEDLVTRVAPRAFGYGHVGTFRYIDANGRLYEEGDRWLRFLNTVVNAMDDLKLAAQTSVKDHSMELYVKKLENLCSAST